MYQTAQPITIIWRTTDRDRRHPLADTILVTPAGFSVRRGWVDIRGKCRTWFLFLGAQRLAELTTRAEACELALLLARVFPSALQSQHRQQA